MQMCFGLYFVLILFFQSKILIALKGFERIVVSLW